MNSNELALELQPEAYALTLERDGWPTSTLYFRKQENAERWMAGYAEEGFEITLVPIEKLFQD